MMGGSLTNPYDLNYLKNQYNEVITLASTKLPETIDYINNLMSALMVTQVHNKEEFSEVKNIRNKLINYRIAFACKLKNDKEKDFARKTELCLIMSMCNLEIPHTLLILNLAINNLYKMKNFVYAGYAVSKYLSIAEKAKQKPANFAKMKKVQALCQKKGTNQHSLEFSEEMMSQEGWFENVDFLNLSLLKGDRRQCIFDGSCYDASMEG